MGVPQGGLDIVVPEQLLDKGHIGALLQKVRCKTMPQTMNSNGFIFAFWNCFLQKK